MPDPIAILQAIQSDETCEYLLLTKKLIFIYTDTPPAVCYSTCLKMIYEFPYLAVEVLSLNGYPNIQINKTNI